MSGEGIELASGVGLPDEEAVAAVARREEDTVGAEFDSGDPIGVLLDFVGEFAGCGVVDANDFSGTAEGDQAWINATGDAARVLPAALVADGGIEAVFWGGSLDVATLVALELTLAPLTTDGRLAADGDVLVEALVGILGDRPKDVRAELARSADLAFLRRRIA